MKIANWLTILALALVFSACTKNSEKDGGQHGGGGYVTYSTPGEVKATIQQALALARESEFTRNVFYDFLSYSDPNDYRKQDLEFLELLLKFFGTTIECIQDDSLRSNGWTRDMPNNETKAEDCNLEFFKSRVPSLMVAAHETIKETGDCGMSTDGHADAFVSGDGKEICYSIERLQRIPPASLLREILALTFHEMFHMAGFDEDQARRVQVKFGAYYDFRFLTANRDWVIANTEDHIATITEIARNIERDVEDFEKDKFVQPWVGFYAVHHSLEQLIFRRDGLALEISMKPESKDSLSAYIFTIANMLDLMLSRKTWYQCSQQGEECDTWSPQNIKELKQMAAELARNAELLDKNWLALKVGSEWDCTPFEEFNTYYKLKGWNSNFGPEAPFFYLPTYTCSNPKKKSDVGR